jgi:hypothetical protein
MHVSEAAGYEAITVFADCSSVDAVEGIFEQLDFIDNPVTFFDTLPTAQRARLSQSFRTCTVVRVLQGGSPSKPALALLFLFLLFIGRFRFLFLCVEHFFERWVLCRV